MSTISVNTLKSAVATYIDTEIVSHMSDWRKWVLGIASVRGVERIPSLIEDNLPLLVSMGFVTEQGEIKIDELYQTLRAVADKKGPITQTIPMLGEVKFGIADIDALYKIAKGV